MRITPLILPVVLAVLIPACTSVGRKIDVASVDQIHVGKTTRQEVDSAIGSPDQMTRNGSGDVTYVYTYAHGEMKPESFIPYIGPLVGGTKSENQTVIVTFGPDGFVKDINSTMGGMETSDNLSAGGKATMPGVKENKRPK